MKVTFDPAKDAINLAKHGISLSVAEQIDWDTALTWTDTRQAYGEPRQCSLALIGTRLYLVAFVDRIEGRRVISLRKANLREVKRYVAEN